MKIGIIQQSCTESVAENRKKIALSISKLAKKGAELVVLQELHDSPYFCQTEDIMNFRYAQSIPGDATEFYSKKARENHVVLVTSLFERRAPGLYHNTAVVFDIDGSIAGRYRKMHIPDDPAYYEKFYFTPGDIGFESTDTKEEQQCQRDAWMTIQRSHAIANGIPVVAVNRVGFEPDPSGATGGIQFWGSSFVAGQQGELLYQASDTKQEAVVVDVDLQRTETVRQWWPFLRDRRIDAFDDLSCRFIETP